MDARMIAPRPAQVSNHCAGKTLLRFKNDGAFCGLPDCGVRVADRSTTPFDLIDAFQVHLDRRHPAPTTVSGPADSIGARLGQAPVITLRSRA